MAATMELAGLHPSESDIPLLGDDDQELEGMDGASGRARAHPGPLPQGSVVPGLGTPTKVKPVTLVVFTMKQGGCWEMRFQSGRLTMVSQIMERLVSDIGLPDDSRDIFNLWMTSRHLQLQLKPYHMPCKIFKRWRDLLSQYTSATYEEVCKDEPILSLRRSVFFPLKEERKLLDPKKDSRKVIDLLYNEAVFNVIHARYPLPPSDVHALAGLQATIYSEETGERGDATALKPHIRKFYPHHMLGEDAKLPTLKFFKAKTAEAKGLLAAFEKSVKETRKKMTDVHQLKTLYLQLCWSKPFYGSVLFRGQIERPFGAAQLLLPGDKVVTVAVNTECVHLFGAGTPPEILLFLTYDQLSWEYQPAPEDGETFFSSLWLDFYSTLQTTEGENQRVCKRLQIFSRQAPLMDAMLSRCTEDIDAREEELRRMRIAQGGEEVLPELSIKTHRDGEAPRVVQQERNYKEHKLKVTTYSTEGEILDDGEFTLARVIKKRSRPKQVSATQHSPVHTPPSTPGTPPTGHHRMRNFGRQHSLTQTSQDSSDL